MQKLIMTIGLPGCGKSFFANNIIKEDFNFIKVERDTLRKELYNTYKFSKAKEKEVTKVQRERILKALKKGQSVIISDTNLNPKTIEKWKQFIIDFNIWKSVDNYNKASSVQCIKYEYNKKENQIVCWYEYLDTNDLKKFYIEYKDHVVYEEKSFLDVPIDICIKQDLQRDRSVGKDVIMEKHIKYVRPNLYKHDSNKPNKQNLILVDIDNTLADKGDRSPYDFDNTHLDKPIIPVFQTIIALYKQGFNIMFCSGREDKFRDKTWTWLEKQFNLFGMTTIEAYAHEYKNSGFISQLYMRKTGDSRKDWVIKREIFMEHFDKQYNVQMVFDDRERVLWMWQDLGIFVFNVNQKENF